MSFTVTYLKVESIDGVIDGVIIDCCVLDGDFIDTKQKNTITIDQ
jgi:hypothetical protein